MAKVFSNATPENIEALKKILERLVGTPLESTGDIEITVGGETYGIDAQEGSTTAAKVQR